VSSVSVSVSHVSKLIRSKEVLLPRTVIFAPMIAGTFLPVCSQTPNRKEEFKTKTKRMKHFRSVKTIAVKMSILVGDIWYLWYSSGSGECPEI
jgi:hypothetical protein